VARGLSAGLEGAVTASTLYPIILIEANLDSGDILMWSGVGDLVYDGKTYLGAGQVLSIGEVVETQSVEARGASFTLSGVPSSLVSLALAENYQNRPVKMYLAALDADGAMLGTPYPIFSGKADVMEVAAGADSATITVSAENDLIILQRTNERRRTPEDQKTKYSGDTFFDKVIALQSKDYVWGKQ